MSGYLKRLASGVRQTGGPIHPLVTPIFSSPQSTGDLEEFREENLSAPSRPATLSERDRPAAVPRPEFHTTAHGVESGIESEVEQRSHVVSDVPSTLVVRAPAVPSPGQPVEPNSRPASEQMPDFTPLVSPGTKARVEQPVLHPQQRSTEPAAMQEPRKPVPTLRPEREDQGKEAVRVQAAREQNTAPDIVPAARFTPQATRESEPPAVTRPAQQQTKSAEPAGVIFKDRYVPLMSDPRNSSDTPALVPQPKPVAPALRSDPRTDFAARPTRPEPDAIEIHIGRIEVTAAPQAPSRPAPTKPARKTLTLDDYLKRRHGRPS